MRWKKNIMDAPDTIETWVKEIYDFYNVSLVDHVNLYSEEKAMFLFRQYKFAPDYAIHARKVSIEKEETESIKTQVFHWFAMLPEEYDSTANEKDFAFSFCYLFTNHLLGFVDEKMVWKVLSYITHHWDEGAALIKVPEGVYE